MNYAEEISKLIKINGVADGDIRASVSEPPDISYGDYSLPCFKFAKALRKSPNDIASDIRAGLLDAKPEWLERVDCVGGYLNFTLDRAFYAADVLNEIIVKGKSYGSSGEGIGKTVCIDFSSINIAKPFHIGHLGTTVIGAALYRVFKKLGYDVVGINHLGDYGTQFGKLIVAYKLWGGGVDLEKNGLSALVEIYVRFHREEEKNPKLSDEAREWFLKIEKGDAEAIRLFKFFKDLTMKEVEKVYKRLGVVFDSYAGESFYNDKMRPVVDALESKNLLKTSDGASIVDLSEYGMPPCIILRRDGASLYATRDLATILYRKKTYDFYKCLYVVATQQNLHFRQIFKVIELMGLEYHRDLEHVAYGMVSLEDGAMSTRAGNVVYLSDVLDKAREKALAIILEKSPDLKDAEKTAEAVGVGAVIFSALINNRIKDNVFSFGKILNFDGETGPYLQYTLARCRSVLEKAGTPSRAKAKKIDAKDLTDAGITGGAGYGLIRLLADFPGVIKAAKENYEPSLITRRLIDIAQAYNKFYYDNRILEADAAKRRPRVALTRAVSDVLKIGFEIIGIPVVEQM